MTTGTQLSLGMQFFSAKKYDDAIREFSRVLSIENGKGCLESISSVNVWVGRCYFEKTEEYVYPYREQFTVSRGQVYFIKPGSLKYSHSTKKMTDRALTFFNKVLEKDCKCTEAHYWKGRALEDQKKIDVAYQSYAEAATHSKEACYFMKCVSIYSDNSNLPFVKVRDLEQITIEEALKALKSNRAYLRMEGCQALSLYQGKVLHSDIKAKIMRSLSTLAGSRVCCFYIGCSGDVDSRVKKFARTIVHKFE